MKIEKLMKNSPISEYEIKLGRTTIIRTNNKDDAEWYLQCIVQDSPDAYLTKDGVRVSYVTKSGIRVGAL